MDVKPSTCTPRPPLGTPNGTLGNMKGLTVKYMHTWAVNRLLLKGQLGRYIPSAYPRTIPSLGRCTETKNVRGFSAGPYTSGSDSNNNLTNNVLGSKWGNVEIPTHTTYTHVLLERISQRPHRIGLINGDTGEKYSYSRVKDHVIRLANSLGRQGVGKGTIVTFCLPNHVQVPLLTMATSLLGAIVHPINHSLTSGEISKLVNVTQPDFLVTSASVLTTFNQVDYTFRKVFSIDRVDGCMPYCELLSQSELVAPKADISLDDTAFIPHSSGTSGLPKGVALSHRNILGQMLSLGHPECSLTTEGDVTVVVFPMAHIGGINLFCNLLYSRATSIWSPVFEFRAYLEKLQNYRVTQITVPPAVSIRLHNDPMVDEYDLSCLKSVGGGGASLGSAIQQGVRDRLNINIFKQAYGMTEVSGVSHIDDATDLMMGSGGKLVPNMYCKIVDVETGEDLPPTCVGEVWIKGSGVMEGYLNNPHDTAKVKTQDGWIKSGDIGYHSDRGHLYIIDRRKDLIKYKGLQVAPAELEAVILLHEDVADAAVVGVADARAGEVPKAFVVLVDGADCGEAEHEIHRFVNERVAQFKQLRGGIVFCESIPKLPSGKILRRILREMV